MNTWQRKFLLIGLSLATALTTGLFFVANWKIQQLKQQLAHNSTEKAELEATIGRLKKDQLEIMQRARQQVEEGEREAQALSAKRLTELSQQAKLLKEARDAMELYREKYTRLMTRFDAQRKQVADNNEGE